MRAPSMRWNERMKLGVVFPQTEIGSDPADVRRYATEVDAAGFDYLATYDHVLGARARQGLSGPYTSAQQFHEVMVMFGYMAAITSRIELATEILVLPQRQAALAAKQAAEVDLLSGGRLRLGVGIGWNWVEYQALGAQFAGRGDRLEEQIALMRELWSRPEVDFSGSFHTVSAAGLNPLPARRIPVWIGASADVGLRRAARLADGWQSEIGPGPQLDDSLARLRGYLAAEGRDPASFGVSGEVGLAPGALDAALSEAGRWSAAGATHVGLTTMRHGLAGAAAHLALLLEFKARWDAAGR